MHDFSNQLLLVLVLQNSGEKDFSNEWEIWKYDVFLNSSKYYNNSEIII